MIEMVNLLKTSISSYKILICIVFTLLGVFKLSGINQGLHSLSQRIIGANTIVQGALPSILKNTPTTFYQDTLSQIEENAKIAYQKLTAVPGFRPGTYVLLMGT